MTLARRAFLRMSFAALATTFLDIPLPTIIEDVPAIELLEVPKVHYKSTIYTLGFQISDELIEDDMYGTSQQLSQLATRWGMTFDE